MAQVSVGLDLGQDTVKRVRLRSTFRQVEVLDATSVPLPRDARPYPERLAEALGALVGPGADAQLVATGLPGDAVSLRLLQLPFADTRRIQQTIGYELEGQIPFGLDEVVFDYRVVDRPADGGARLLVAICQQARLGQWMELLQAARVDPRLLGADSLAYGSLMDLLPAAGAGGAPAAEGGSSLIVDIGLRMTNLCFLGPEGVEFARSLSGGGQEATARLAEAFKLDESRAEDGKRRAGYLEVGGETAGSPEQVMVSDALRKAVDGLVREIRQTLGSHRNLTGRETARVFLCGGGARLQNLDRYLAGELGLPVSRLEASQLELPGAGRLAEGEAVGTDWTKALALALQAHQGGRHGWLNLRKGAFAFKGDFAQMRGVALTSVVAVLILVLLGLGNAVVQWLGLRSTDQALDGRIREVTQAILGKPYDNIDVALSIIKEKTSPEADLLPRVTALANLRQIHERLPAEVKVRLKDVNISPKKIRLEGYTDSFESVERMKAELEKEKCFTKVEPGRTRRTKDESEVEFELTIVGGC
ncbi:MAG TPA: pilus assembly protein PilM [Myxococcota bacterium]|nr:pilus assembly protein PilM [Myxococcota bacterium]HRY94829.1 pilus assembly protein PilM [Myxococcota bacterium]HSA21754.1 pilus assembly protein PilM [Myxococcota bacterium]